MCRYTAFPVWPLLPVCWGGRSWQVVHQARYTDAYAYVQSDYVVIVLYFVQCIYKARHYTDCVASVAEESMHGVVDTVKALPEYSTSGEVIYSHFLIPSIIGLDDTDVAYITIFLVGDHRRSS